MKTYHYHEHHSYASLVQAGGEGPPYPLWHLEPLYVRKIPDKSEEKRSVSNDEDGVRSVSQVQESLMTSVNGDQQSMSQQLDQGQRLYFELKSEI